MTNNSTTNNFDSLVDHGIIKAAADKLADAKSRLADAHAARDVALREHAAAKVAYDSACDCNDNDPHVAHAAMKAAEAAVAVHTDMLGKPAFAVSRAETALAQAKLTAQQPKHDGACAAAIAACAKADAGRALVTAAESEFRAAISAFTEAVIDGAQPAYRGLGVDAGSPSLTRADGVWTLPSETEIRKRFGKMAA